MKTRLAATVLAVLLGAVPALAHAGPDGKARAQYILGCAGCHQVDGSGVSRSGIPTMRNQLGHFLSLPDGRAFLVKVPGTSNSAFSNADVARMLNWMAHAFSEATLPAGFTPYTEAEVAAYRKAPLDDVPGARAAIVAQLAARGVVVE